MIVYVAIWKDRHADTSVHLFSSKEKAIEWAAATAREYDRFGDLDEELTSAMKSGPNPWLYYGRYSGEDDCIYVEARKLDQEIESPEVTSTECCCCGFETTKLAHTDAPAGIKHNCPDHPGFWLCGICYSTFASNAVLYPGQYGEQAAMLQTLAYTANRILQRLEERS